MTQVLSGSTHWVIYALANAVSLEQILKRSAGGQLTLRGALFS